ncbi:MAG: CHAT domain-containing protein, partial [Alphaproteobacteria bacterium]|nr:CHAT domain-containing protein [Alphaproteobacteria bacterium]
EARMVYDALRAELNGAGSDGNGTRFDRALRADPTYALSLLRTGQVAAARRAAETAEAQARLLYGPRHARTAETGAVLAAALAEAGQREQALARFRASMPTLIAAGVEAADAETPARAARLRVVAEAYLRALARSLGAGAQGLAVDGPRLALVEEMMRAAEAARSRRLLESIAASVERSGLADAGLADLVRREQDSGRRIRALYDSLAGLYALPASERGRQDTVLRAQIEQTETERAALRRQVAQRRPALADIARPSPPTLAELRRALNPEEALVALFVGDKRSYAFAVPKHGPAAVVEAPIGGDAVIEAVVLLRAAMMAEGAIDRLRAFDARSAYERLYVPLLKPLESAFAGARELLVVADGALTQVPWSLLPTAPVALAPASGGAPGAVRFAEYRQVPWLIRRQAVVHLPSATALVALRRATSAARPQRPFVGFGDPIFTADARNAATATRGVTMRAALPRALGRSAAIEAVESLPALPDTRAELQQIARELGANASTELFLGPKASESQVRRARLERYRVVAFATHGLAPGDIDGLLQPALALSSPRVTAEDGDGLLTMAEVLELRLAADWVVLSACNTAGAAEPGADVLSGLASAFFYSGARSLLVTHWAVETVSARLITTGTFAARNVSRAEALRQAMLALIDGKAGQGSEGGRPFSYAHPVFWAPFALVGDAG